MLDYVCEHGYVLGMCCSHMLVRALPLRLYRIFSSCPCQHPGVSHCRAHLPTACCCMAASSHPSLPAGAWTPP